LGGKELRAIHRHKDIGWMGAEAMGGAGY
jgi:hypothetical protein